MSSKNSTPPSADSRLPVQRTCKLYIGGQFPRSESGRTYHPAPYGRSLGNICQASRKDFRNAVSAARQAQTAWGDKSAGNRGQILYRVAELMEGRRQQFLDELLWQGLQQEKAESETDAAIDRLIYYAGWSDKFQQIFSTVNPVASPHYNFSMLEPVGVVALLASPAQPLLGLVSLVAPIIVSGNSCVVLAAEEIPWSAVTMAEVFHASDVPAGVINILTGLRSELAPHFASHMDVNSVAVDTPRPELVRQIEELAADNMKRFRQYHLDWAEPENRNPYLIEDFCELKTTWHPIEKIGPAGSGY